jgi:hypothetical protein
MTTFWEHQPAAPKQKIIAWFRVRRQHLDEEQGARVTRRLRELLESEDLVATSTGPRVLTKKSA